MRATRASELLAVWECGVDGTAAERALQLLAHALPGRPLESLADFDLGLRDWHLLALRRRLFGSALEAWADCSRCEQRLELTLDAGELLGEAPPADPPQHVTAHGASYRLPNGRDLLAIAPLDDAEAAARALFARCCVAGSGRDEDRVEVEDALAVLAAERALALELTCPACNEHWRIDFDPAAFLWEEIQARALALLDDVHQLAAAYGWSERAILRMSDARRSAYLRMNA